MVRVAACIVAVAVTVLLGSKRAEAGKVKVWHHAAKSDFTDAKLQHTVISSTGVVSLSRELESLAKVDAAHVWDVCEDGDGNLFFATGTAGKLYKRTPDGKLDVAYRSEDSQILSLARAADGSVYAGTGPNGTLVRIDPKGAAKVVASGLDAYVWSLVQDPVTKDLFAGTGPKGRIFRVDPDGKATVFYDTKQNHILSLARGPKASLYAGTDQGGLVYRIDRAGKGFILYDAKQDEIRSLLVTPEGLYAGTSSPVSKSARLGRRAGVKLAMGQARRSVLLDVAHLASDLTLTAPAPSSPKAGENSVYRVDDDGTVTEVFRVKAMILSMVRRNGKLIVGTGMKGQLFEVDPKSKDEIELTRLDHGQIHCLFRRRDGSIVVGTGDPGRVYLLRDAYTAEGTVTSEVLDAGIISRWGAIRWSVSTPEGTSVSIATRSGNVSQPDNTWSDWSKEAVKSDGASIHSPTARFLQYRITLRTTQPRLTPEVKSVTLRYLNANQAPAITKLTVPNLDSEDLDDPKSLEIEWSVVDPNEDELTYRVFVRKDNWKGWVLVKDDLDSTSYKWKTKGFPSGRYRVKVVASDRKDNDPKEALTASRTSGVIPISHRPPAVRLTFKQLDGRRGILEGRAVDPSLRLTRASYAVNGAKWHTVFPVDGLFDTKSERFVIRTEPLPLGTHVVVLQVRDAAGNVGSSDAVFTVTD